MNSVPPTFRRSPYGPRATLGGIPKVIHRIWLGSKSLPHKYTDYANTWAINSPQWSERWWFDEDIENLMPFVNRSLYEASDNLGERSDIARYEILRNFGGLYVDTDVECLRDIDKLVDHNGVSAFVGIESFNKVEQKTIYGNAVIASTRHHPLMNDLVTSLWRSVSDSYQQNIGRVWQIVKGSGPHYLTRVVNRNRSNVTIYKNTAFYPGFDSERFDYYRPFLNVVNKKLAPDSYAIHHWDNSWIGR